MFFFSLVFGASQCAFAEKSDSKRAEAKKNSEGPKKNKRLRNQKSKKDSFDQSTVLPKIYQRQAKRAAKIRLFKSKGHIGEADNGLLKIRSLSSLPAKQKKFLEKLVKIENSDREKIFSIIQKDVLSTKENKQSMRLRYFENNLASDAKGIYYFRADHWTKK